MGKSAEVFAYYSPSEFGHQIMLYSMAMTEIIIGMVWFYFRLTGYTVQGMNLVTFSREGE